MAARQAEMVEALLAAERLGCPADAHVLTYPNRPGPCPSGTSATPDSVGAAQRLREERIDSKALPAIFLDLCASPQRTGVGGPDHYRGQAVHHKLDRPLQLVGAGGRAVVSQRECGVRECRVSEESSLLPPPLSCMAVCLPFSSSPVGSFPVFCFRPCPPPWMCTLPPWAITMVTQGG